MLGNVTLVADPAEADVALLMVSPQSGAYFNATPGYLELDICEGKTVCNVDESGKPTAETHQETTLVGASRIPGIARRSTHTAARSFPTSTARWPGKSAASKKSPTR